MTAELRHEWRKINGVRLHCVITGSGPLVILLHGFPEAWFSWRSQIPVLAEHFTVVVPDLRGYNLSDKPQGVRSYQLPTLVEDVVQLIYSFGEDQAHVVGHDWGGVIAWSLAAHHPEVCRTLTIMNAPHPRIGTQQLLLNPQQRLRSWYVFFLQLPWLPELLIRARNYAALEYMIPNTAVHPERFNAEVMSDFKAALAQPGALTSVINYYRAFARPVSQAYFLGGDQILELPVQVIWGEQDTALGIEMTHNLERYLSNLTLHVIPTASHWVQQDEPEIVNAYLLDFLRFGPQPTSNSDGVAIELPRPS